MKALGFITICLCCVAAPLAAQDTSHARHPGMHPGMKGRGGMGGGDEMMSMMREMMAPLMGIIAYTPEHLLARKDSLKLTSDQVSKLTAIQTSAKAAHDAGAADFKTHIGVVSQSFQAAAPDTAAMRPHFDEAHAAMGKAHWAMIVAASQSRAVLTDAQRQKVDAWVAAMQQRMQEGRTM
ncbi:MAG TPA: Spy/CpxP family protein refolding chaperone [Gemmatimonadales bacterium]|nr:Spy/CpxP family protein refolding chaperone [Gemmatimonadales bacterium]